MNKVYQINTRPRDVIHRGVVITYSFNPETKEWEYSWEVTRTYTHKFKGAVKAKTQKELLKQVRETIDHFLDKALQTDLTD